MDQVMVRVIQAVCEDTATPRSLTVEILVRYGEWSQLGELRVEPSHYVDAERYFQDSVVTDLLRKCLLPSGVDKADVALQTFFSCEKENLRTNIRLTRFLPDSLFLEDRVDETVYRFIGDWRKEVSFVLGNLPDGLTPQFSGGATYGDAGRLTTIPDKMSSHSTIYSGTRDLLSYWYECSWGRATVQQRAFQSDPLTVRGNVFFTVPKDGKTDRGCCKEASIPVSLQLSAAKVMRRRLLRINIDLINAKPLHMSLAREASVTGELATIDMSNASDTVCRVLPKLVLRDDWWELLNSLRATHTRVKGRWHRLEKFSSMGNGFTFELETILFATLARVVVRAKGGDPDRVRCNGDDLIVPADTASEVVASLRFFGFTPNMKKTYLVGPFRESCGGDYFSGVPVRAHFIKELPDEPQKWISLANGLRRVCHVDGVLQPNRWKRLRRAWLIALSAIPDNIRRCRGPEYLGDIVIHDVPESWSWASNRFHPSWDARELYAYTPVPVVLPWYHWSPAVQLACCTLGLPSTGVVPRGGTSGFRITRVVANLTGSWLP